MTDLTVITKSADELKSGFKKMWCIEQRKNINRQQKDTNIWQFLKQKQNNEFA